VIRLGDRMLSGIGVISWVADTYKPAGHTRSRPLRQKPAARMSAAKCLSGAVKSRVSLR
jgi:hypothetical protein